MKLEFSWQILEKSSAIKFHENPSSESRIVPFGHRQISRHDKINSCFSQFLRTSLKTYKKLFVRNSHVDSYQRPLTEYPDCHSADHNITDTALYNNILADTKCRIYPFQWLYSVCSSCARTFVYANTTTTSYLYVFVDLYTCIYSDDATDFYVFWTVHCDIPV
jgi:hypothetical protein